MKIQKLLAILLSTIMILTIVPMSESSAAIEISTPNLTAGANLSGTKVYFGSFNILGIPSAEPILWHVVATDSDTATLWTSTNIGSRQYDPVSHNNWSWSEIAEWLNGTGGFTGDGFLPTAFSAGERGAMVSEYGTANEPYDYGTIDSRQTIVLPSVAEMGSGTGTGTWNINQANRTFSDGWKLRSPGSLHNSAAVVIADYGHVYPAGTLVTIRGGVRPAFKLNLSSVIFTSAASGANTKSSATLGSGLVSAATPTGAVKLTLLDSDLTLTCTDTTTRTVRPGGTVSITYSNATAGTNNFVSAVIVNSAGTVLYYGKLADAASGMASFNVPASLSEGEYTIRLFAEQVNGDNYTDFASMPINIPLTVDNSALPTYPVTVVNGTIGDTGSSNGHFAEDAIVPILANTPPAGQKFKEWQITPVVTFIRGNENNPDADFIMPVENVTATAVFEEDPDINLPVIKHFNKWTGSETMTARIDAVSENFIQLTLDGDTVDTDNYTVTAGSTIITLHESYLKILANGDYTFRAEFTNGYANLNLTVDVQPATGPPHNIPQTSDNRSFLLPTIALSLGFLCITGAVFYRRRSKKK